MYPLITFVKRVVPCKIFCLFYNANSIINFTSMMHTFKKIWCCSGYIAVDTYRCNTVTHSVSIAHNASVYPAGVSSRSRRPPAFIEGESTCPLCGSLLRASDLVEHYEKELKAITSELDQWVIVLSLGCRFSLSGCNRACSSEVVNRWTCYWFIPERKVHVYTYWAVFCLGLPLLAENEKHGSLQELVRKSHKLRRTHARM